MLATSSLLNAWDDGGQRFPDLAGGGVLVPGQGRLVHADFSAWRAGKKRCHRTTDAARSWDVIVEPPELVAALSAHRGVAGAR